MKTIRNAALAALAGALLFPAAAAAQGSVPDRLAVQGRADALGGADTLDGRARVPKYAPNQVLVRFRAGTPKSWMMSAHTVVRAEVVRSFRLVNNLQLVRLPKELRVEEAIERYRRDPNVLYAEPNYTVYVLAEPNDPRFQDGSLWGLHNTGQLGGVSDADIDAAEAWELSTGSRDVVVAVIDTGIQYTHPDLAANMLQLEADCADGVDNDGNGRIDDCFGFDFADLECFDFECEDREPDSDPMDDHGHGTHVAGTIGAVGNNGAGVVGVNWQVGLLACKFLNSFGGGSIEGAIACLDYLADLKQNQGVNLVATNNSWGGDGFSQSLLDAIDVHRQLGILFIAAAGNSATNNDQIPHYPSSYFLPNIIAVAATDRNDARSSFSSFGRFSVHLGAPGSSILSTTPSNNYQSFSGTSMATPHVTGVAALLKAEDPSRDWKAIKNLLLAGGDDKPSMDGVTVTGKRLNAHGAMKCTDPAVVPDPVVATRLQPTRQSLVWSVGMPLPLAALHINCALPAGNVDVVVTPGNTTVTLLDNGAGTDLEAGDGVYSGTWTPADNQTYTLSFPGGDEVTVFFPQPYRWSLVGSNYRTLPGATNLGFTDDSVGQITPPFPLQFGGVNFSSLIISANGLVTLDGAAPFHNPNETLSTPLFATLVAPFWDDLYPVGGTKRNVFWAVQGGAPNRELIIESRNVRHFTCRNNDLLRVRFQAVFFENSSSILFDYKDTVFGGKCSFADLGGSATVGVQANPAQAMQYSFDSPDLPTPIALLWELDADAPAPALDSLSPPNIGAGNATFTLTVNGGGFTSDSLVEWNGSARDTFFVSPSQLQATIFASDVASVGSADVTVFTPAPGGGTSAPLPFAITVATNATFKGKVKDSSKVGIAGATVTAFQGSTPMFSAITNADGRYILNVANGTYDLVASKPGFMDKARAGMTINAGQTITKVNFKLFVTTAFAGTVTDALGGAPLEAALVEVIKKGVVRGSTLTESDGSYIVEVIPKTYKVRASLDGYVTSSQKGQEAVEGETTTVDFDLDPE